jgi:hypothetical protein
MIGAERRTSGVSAGRHANTIPKIRVVGAVTFDHDIPVGTVASVGEPGYDPGHATRPSELTRTPGSQ